MKKREIKFKNDVYRGKNIQYMLHRTNMPHPRHCNVLKCKAFKSFQVSGDERIKYTHMDTQIHIDYFCCCSSWAFLHQFLFSVISWPHRQACGILVPRSGIKPMLPAGQAESYPLYHQGNLTNTHWCHKKNKGKLSYMRIFMRILDHQTTFQLSELYSQIDCSFLIFLHDSVNSGHHLSLDHLLS